MSTETERGEGLMFDDVDITGREVDLRADGVLYEINRRIFHPLGFSLAMRPQSRQFVLLGGGNEPMRFVDQPGDVTNAEREAAFATLIERHRATESDPLAVTSRHGGTQRG